MLLLNLCVNILSLSAVCKGIEVIVIDSISDYYSYPNLAIETVIIGYQFNEFREIDLEKTNTLFINIGALERLAIVATYNGEDPDSIVDGFLSTLGPVSKMITISREVLQQKQIVHLESKWKRSWNSFTSLLKGWNLYIDGINGKQEQVIETSVKWTSNKKYWSSTESVITSSNNLFSNMATSSEWLGRAATRSECGGGLYAIYDGSAERPLKKEIITFGISTYTENGLGNCTTTIPNSDISEAIRKGLLTWEGKNVESGCISLSDSGNWRGDVRGTYAASLANTGKNIWTVECHEI